MTQIIRSNNRAVMYVDTEKEAQQQIKKMTLPNLSYSEWKPQKKSHSTRSRRARREEAKNA